MIILLLKVFFYIIIEKLKYISEFYFSFNNINSKKKVEMVNNGPIGTSSVNVGKILNSLFDAEKKKIWDNKLYSPKFCLQLQFCWLS